MHVLVVLVELGRVLLGGEARQALLVYIHAQWLVARHDHVDPEIELVSVDEERVRDVARNDRSVIDVELLERLNQVDATTARRVCWFDDPHVTLRLRLAELQVVLMEVVELIGQDVGLGDEIELQAPEALLHLHVVVAQAVLARDLVALREVIDALELVQAFVEVALARARRPEEVPLVRVCVTEPIMLQNRSHKFGVTLQQLVQHLAVIDVVAATDAIRLQRVGQELRFCDRFEVNLLVESIQGRRVQILRQVLQTGFEVFIAFEEVLLGSIVRSVVC